MSEALRWTPVASDQAGWLEATQQLRTVVNNTSLQAPNYEPWGKLLALPFFAVLRVATAPKHCRKPYNRGPPPLCQATRVCKQPVIQIGSIS
jgi:hypothetical protein